MTTTVSSPPTRVSSPALPPHRFSTPPPPAPPPSKAIPQDFRSSLSAWWNNASYKEARIAEERLLRRMAMYEPPTPASPAKGWFGSAPQPQPETDSAHTPSQHSLAISTAENRAGECVSAPVELEGTSLVATLRNVFIPTPNPADAPAHPADQRDPSSPTSSTTSLGKHKSLNPLKRHSGVHSSSAQVSPAGTPASSSASLHTGAGTGADANGAESQVHGNEHARSHGAHKHKHKDYINTLEISSPENAGSKEAVVVLHGYAAALGFFFRNWESVALSANSSGRRTFFLDWLGMGLSSRPSPSLLSSPSSSPIPRRVARAEHFFLSSLESWRQQAGLDRLVLVGHSLGGYLASAYAVRYPERVAGLILVSPAGIPRGPEYRKYKTTAEGGENEGSDDEAAIAAAEMELGNGNGKPEAKGEAKQWQENRQSFTRRNMMKFFVWGWERGISPFSFLRGMGPWGPMFAGRYASRRFAAQSEVDRNDLHSYIYNTSILKGSGEYCISHILAPGAYARIPIVDRIHHVKVPVTFLYGDNDWMDVDGGHASVKELSSAGNSRAQVHVVPKAGHHVYLDNPEETNRIVDEAIKALPRVSAAATVAAAATSPAPA
ncbi:hypothetical protein JCM24511_07965 [Saitozyma sp. JCM 24511]|nr:hypothetical protein JCM24511_07965 [Saitozyma sp. JCM 24511]